MKVLNDVLGYKDLKIYQDLDYFCFSLDSVILANFAEIRLKDKNICDLGTGNGVVPLILSKRTSNSIVGVEIQEKLASMAVESVKYNNLDNQIKIINSDIADSSLFNYNEFFDLVLSNPPYFKINEGSAINLSYEKQVARHEIKMDLDKLCMVTNRILKDGGNFCLVHRPDRLLEILSTMQKYDIQPKKIMFVHEKINKDSKLVFIQGQKHGKIGLKVLKPFVLYNEDGSIRPEYLKMTEEVIK